MNKNSGEIRKFISEKKVVISIFFVLVMFLLVFITPYYGSTDLGDYSDVAKYFAGKQKADIRASHSLLFGYLHYPFVKLLDSFFIFKITSVLFLIMIVFSLYYTTKKKEVLWLSLFCPIFWYMAPWINPIQISGLLFLWGYILIKKYQKSENIKFLLLSGFFIGLALSFWNTILYLSLFLILAFLFNRKLQDTFLFSFALLIGLFPLLLFDTIIYGFPLYTTIKTTAGNLVATFLGNIYGTGKNSFNFLTLILIIATIPICFWKSFKLSSLKENFSDVLFISLSILLIISNTQLRYVLVIIPIILFFISDKLNKKEFKLQTIIYVTITILIGFSFILQIFYASSSNCELTCLLKGDATFKSANYGEMLKEDLSKLGEDYPQQVFIVGNNPDDSQNFASIYWGKNIKKFVSIQDYNAWLTNQTTLFEKRYTPSITIPDRRILWFGGGMKVNSAVFVGFEEIKYAISPSNEELGIEGFTSVQNYSVITLYKKV